MWLTLPVNLDDTNVQHVQNKKILQRALPATLKLSIAKNIENHLFSKVLTLKID